jgi:hypothetical protein
MLQRKPSLHESHPLSSRGPSKQKGSLRSIMKMIANGLASAGQIDRGSRP